ncbi:MAG: B12-binding domain-containing radical SAM protein [Pseudomonadota bacterium]
MERVLLVNPFVYDFTAFDFWAKPRGLLDLGGMLSRLGLAVDFVDCMSKEDRDMAAFAASRPEIEKPKLKKYGTGSYFREEAPKPAGLKAMPRRFFRFGFHPGLLRRRLESLPSPPRLIGVTGIMTYWNRGVKDTIAVLRQCFPGVPVVLGGIYPTLAPNHAEAESGAQIIFKGRATRERVVELLDEAGLGRRVEAGGAGPPYYPYPDPPYGILSTSEGCMKKCTYCASRVLQPRFIEHDMQRVLGNMKHLYERGIRDFAFYDDFLLHRRKERLLPLLEKVIAHMPAARFHTPNGLLLAHVDGETAALMKKSNFKTLRFGFETADPGLGRRTGFKIDREGFRKKIAVLRDAGFENERIGIYIMVGLPGQPVRDVEESIRFVKDCGVDANLTEFSPVPGTPEFRRALRESAVDFESDTELQNNTLLPLRSPVFTNDVLNRLKNLSYSAQLRAEGNLSPV